jgi:hypothetical protein
MRNPFAKRPGAEATIGRKSEMPKVNPVLWKQTGRVQGQIP